MRRTNAPVRIAFAVLMAALAFDAPADDFAAALTRAYVANFDLGIARSQLSASDEGVSLALAARRPVVGAFVSGGKAVFDQWPYSPTNKPSAVRDFNYDQRAIGITLNQPIYSGGSLDAQRDGAEAQVLASRARLQIAEQQVLLAAASAYIDLWLAERKQAILRESEGDLRLQLAANQSQFQRRDTTTTDLGQTETRLAQAVAARVQGESALADAKMTYRVVIGADAGELGGLPELERLPASLDAALSRAGAGNPAIAAAIHSKNAAIEGVALQKAGWKPSLSFSYQNLDSAGLAAGVPRLKQETLLLNASVPIYRGGAVGARIRTAREQLTKAETAIEESQRSTVQSTANAWYAYEAATAAAASYRVQVTAAQFALKGVDLAAAHGTRTELDKLNARLELENARLSLAQADHDCVLAAMQLLAAMGELNARKLALPTAHYDPAPHYEQSKGRWSDQDWQR